MTASNPISPKGGYNNIAIDFFSPKTAGGDFVFLDAVESGNEIARISNAGNFSIVGSLAVGDDLTVTGDATITGSFLTDIISEKTSAAGVTIDSVLLKDNAVTATNVTATTALLSNTISERTAGSGVTIDSVQLKDGTISLGTTSTTFRINAYHATADCVGLIQGLQTESGGTAKAGLQIDVNGKGGFCWQNDASSGTKNLKLIANSGYGVSETTVMTVSSAGNVTVNDSIMFKDASKTPIATSGYIELWGGGDGKLYYSNGVDVYQISSLKIS